MTHYLRGLVPVLTALLITRPCDGAVRLVGPQHTLKTPSQAARVATDGDIVLIEAGTYRGDAAIWPQNRLTLRGNNGRAHLRADGSAAEKKAIWVLQGNDIRIENIEFSEAAVPAMNGAGIRFEGTNLSISNCHFHHNQMGILTGTNLLSEIVIEGSEFNDNTVDYPRYGSLGHNIYIGNIRRFTLSHSYIHDAETGHNVKSRAQENYLLYNRIGDEKKASSYLVDFPNGGQAFVIGNQFRQSPDSENSTMVSFAAEHNRELSGQALYLVNNTFVNDRPRGVFVNNHSRSPATLINNLLAGASGRIEGLYKEYRSQFTSKASFNNPSDYDYRLQADSSAIDQGTEPGIADNGFPLRPKFQYRHPLAVETRISQGAIDIGAYEFKP
ncbi:right-handed parallel beta-helix repeat-containing protein [Methylomonas sp. MgM2]